MLKYNLPGELGDQPERLGTLAGMVKSPRGSLKIFSEHSLVVFLSYSTVTLGKEVETFTEECSDSELIKWDACGRSLLKN